MSGPTPDVVYRRPLHGGSSYVVPGLLWLAATGWLLTLWPDGLTALSVVVSVVLPGLVLGPWIGTLAHGDRTGTLTVSRGGVRVGRTELGRELLDRDWLLELARAEVPAAYLRHAGPGATWTPRTPVRRPAVRTRRLGPTGGSDHLLLRLTNGESVSLAVADRAEAVAALLDALG